MTRVVQLTLDYAVKPIVPKTPRPSSHLTDPDPMSKRTRRHDHATSRQGAEHIALKAGSQKAKLLRAYYEWATVAPNGGLNDEEAAQNAGLNMRSCFWKRSGELRNLGYIKISTDTNGDPIVRKGSSGVERIVCHITAAGRSAYDRAIYGQRDSAQE